MATSLSSLPRRLPRLSLPSSLSLSSSSSSLVRSMSTPLPPPDASSSSPRARPVKGRRSPSAREPEAPLAPLPDLNDTPLKRPAPILPNWRDLDPRNTKGKGLAAFDTFTDLQSLPVTTDSVNCCRIYYLNRPEKLNALNTEMVDLLGDALDNWAASRLSKIIIGRGKGGKAFCAGGDIKLIAEMSSHESTRGKAMEFFKKEFELDWKLACLSVGGHAWDGSKSYIALMDGLTMGGGAGLAFGAVVRVATETTRFAMPETVIGYTPDVGSTHYLSLLDGYIGRYLALTGVTVKGRECLDLGLATHYVVSRNLDLLVARLSAIEDVDNNGGVDAVLSILADYEARFEDEKTRARKGLDKWSPTDSDGPTRLVGDVRVLLDHAFAKSSVYEIVKELESRVLKGEAEAEWEVATEEEREVSNWAKETVEILRSRSPISLEVTLKGMVEAENDLKKVERQIAEERSSGKARYEAVPPNEALRLALHREYRAVEQFVHNVSPDFPSGVIRKLVTKMAPNWDLTVDPVTRALDFYPDPSVTPLRPSTPELVLDHPTHGFDKFHFRSFGLPTESEIKDVVQGNHRTSGDLAMDESRVLGIFKDKFDWTRRGTKQRVVEVLNRMTIKNTDGYLVWSPPRPSPIPLARKRALDGARLRALESTTTTPTPNSSTTANEAAPLREGSRSIYPSPKALEEELMAEQVAREERERVENEAKVLVEEEERRKVEAREEEEQMKRDEEERRERDAEDVEERVEEKRGEEEEEEVYRERIAKGE